MNQSLASDLSGLPELPRDLEGVRAAVHRRLESERIKIAVIDDDPTGTQTVADVPLVTSWGEPELEWAMARATPLFGVLTNSRALPEDEARAISRTIAERLVAVSRRLGFGLRVISRSDSTLRGHFPAEPDALSAGLAAAGVGVDAVLVCPAFPRAGRVTIDGLHLVRSGERLVPVGSSEYAADPAFGYRSSNLQGWVRERVGGDPAVGAVSLDDLRQGGVERVARRLLEATGSGARYVVADAVEDGDLEVLAGGVDLAESQGLRLIYRTGPSFLSARAGLPTPPPLASEEVAAPGGRGLVVIGSYTDLTTAQLDRASRAHALATVDLSVGRLLAASPAVAQDLVSRAEEELREALAEGDAALVTSRVPLHAETGAASLGSSEAIASALVEIVASVAAEVPLAWIVAKGGITSHSIAVRALEARRVTVLGQLFLGQVSVWKLDATSLRPGLRYVVFPGNVGDELTLARAIGRLKGAE
jgi:uncharacterized protein YgbK (DUF1537 family)